MPALKYFPALDGLRGVAILMVILTHCASGWPAAAAIYPSGAPLGPPLSLPAWLSFAGGQAMHGVQLFFVVSAFTLAMRPVRTADELAQFALRRIARIGPAYWLAGVAYLALAGFAPRLWAPQGVTPSDIALAFTFGSAWQGGASLAVVPGGWSVACEASFYLLLPLLLKIIDGRVWRALLLSVLAIVLAQFRAACATSHGDLPFGAFVNPIEQAPVFLFGVTASLFVTRRQPRWRTAAVLLAAMALISATVLPPPSEHLLPHSGLAALFAPLVAVAAITPPPVLRSLWLRRVGEVSYSMYLIHFAVLAPSIWLAERLVPSNDWRTLAVHFVLSACASFGLACVTYALVEEPAIRWAAAQTSLVPARSRPAPT